MQNAYNNDLQNGSLDKSGYDKCVYVKSEDYLHIQDLKSIGYVIIDDSDTSDLTLMGLPKPKKAEVKQDKHEHKPKPKKAK